MAEKKKPRGGNNILKTENMLNVDKGDNAKFLAVNMELFNMGEIDLHDEEAVINRLNEYFKLYFDNDMKPTVAGMANALGFKSRTTLWAIVNDQPTGGAGYKSALPTEVANVIKKAHFLLENLWESYMNSGKINPVSGIFLGKNHFGMQDKMEHVITPNQNGDNDYDVAAIKARYLTDSDKKD